MMMNFECTLVECVLKLSSNFTKKFKMKSQQQLSNIQQELLKLYSSDLEESDLLHIKKYLGNYFANKAIQGADKIWEEKRYSNKTMRQ